MKAIILFLFMYLKKKSYNFFIKYLLIPSMSTRMVWQIWSDVQWCWVPGDGDGVQGEHNHRRGGDAVGVRGCWVVGWRFRSPGWWSGEGDQDWGDGGEYPEMWVQVENIQRRGWSWWWVLTLEMDSRSPCPDEDEKETVVTTDGEYRVEYNLRRRTVWVMVVMVGTHIGLQESRLSRARARVEGEEEMTEAGASSWVK